MKAKVASIAYHLPERVVTSSEIEETLRTNNPGIRVTPGVIEAATGIRARCFASEGQFNSHFAAEAGKKALAGASLAPADIDLLIFAAAGQDLIEPATAHIVQDMLGTHCRTFDIKNACNSFINALEVAEALILSGAHKRILIATGEVPSCALKWQLKDRDDFKKSFASFTLGDAGAAAVITASNDDTGIMAHSGTAESSEWQTGTLPGGGSRHPRGEEFTYFRGDGAALKNAFAKAGPDFLAKFLNEQKISLSDINRVFIHQVSEAYLESFASVVGIPQEKVEHTIREFGNIAAATLPLGICLALEDDRLKKGDIILLVGLGGGISIELMLMRW